MGLAGLATILLVAIPKTIIILGFPVATTIIATEVARRRAEQRLRARARQRSLTRCVTQSPSAALDRRLVIAGARVSGVG